MKEREISDISLEFQPPKKNYDPVLEISSFFLLCEEVLGGAMGRVRWRPGQGVAEGYGGILGARKSKFFDFFEKFQKCPKWVENVFR